MMIGSRYRNLAVASAAALLAVSLSVPAQADNSTSPSAAAVTDVSSANVPTPRARPAAVRKRVASTASVYRAQPRQDASLVSRPYRMAAHWPVLFIGVGW
ncbi:MAG: hypothetical protein ACJ8E5_12760 [Xanthobacteraceae bacterium]|jgi:hypothetical protein